MKTTKEGRKILSVHDAAKITGKSSGFIYALLRTGKCPFGTAVQMPGGRWSNSISEHLLRQYIGDKAVNEWINKQSS